jgi:hypothetical protein
MEFVTTKKRTATSLSKNYGDESNDPSYGSNFFYVLPPTEEIQLEEFETLALDRLKGWCYFSH